MQPRLPHSFVQLASRLIVMVKLVLGHGNVADYKVEPTLHFVVAMRALLLHHPANGTWLAHIVVILKSLRIITSATQFSGLS